MKNRAQVFVVYQDCPFCGPWKKWGEVQQETATQHGVEIVKLSFIHEEAKELILAARKKGVAVPFFTDGKKFSKNVLDFVEKPSKKKGAKRGASKKNHG